MVSAGLASAAVGAGRPAAIPTGPRPASPGASPAVPPAAAAAPGAAAPAPAAPAVLVNPDPNAQDGSLSGPGPLVTNGLGSPSCRDPQALAQLSAASRANCASSGIAAAPAPLENYELDIHVDQELVSLNLDSLIPDIVVQYPWMALVWLVHVAVVALEWCFSLDLLGSGTLGPVTRGLQTMRDALTTPWLAAALAFASVAFVYNGVVRRRVVETLGQFVVMLAMMTGGLWVIADPSGTVGAASQLVNQATLGAVGAAATGDPDHPVRSLDDALGQLFDVEVTGPWCYLEFGNVAWCDQTSRLDPRLVAAAGDIVTHDRAGATGAAGRRQVQVEAAQIARARTNGELFLALPSNGPRRNSINADASNPSLLRVLCGGDNATSCPADTGPQAEFRTKKGTPARIGGLLLIAIGAAGMLALIGFLCLRLLGAALLALLYLLLAPIAVLAPALGDGGRAAFRHWSLRLAGAVLAKLVYAVFLGVVLLMVRVLAALGGIGWWTQWVMIAVFWWLVFNHRHRVLEHVIHERGEPSRQPSFGNRIFATRQAAKLASPAVRQVVGAGRRGEEHLRRLGGRVVGHVRRRAAADHSAVLAEQVAGTLEHDHAAAVATMARASSLELGLGDLRARREGLAQAKTVADRQGDRRSSVSLQRREHDVQARIIAGERDLATARASVPVGEEHHRRTGVVHDEAQRTARAALLDREARLRPLVASSSDRRVGRRDYAGTAQLVGLDRQAYESLPDDRRRRTQLEIDRKLERRWEGLQAIDRAKPPEPPRLDHGTGRRERELPPHGASSPTRAPASPHRDRRGRQFDRHVR